MVMTVLLPHHYPGHRRVQISRLLDLGVVIAARGSPVALRTGMTKLPVSRPWDQDDDSEYTDGAELPLAVRVAFGLLAWTGDVVGDVLEAMFDDTKM
jgi:hypothetical protein